MSETGYIFDIKKYSINDGPGIRTTVFLKGCPLNCIWCHNPESHNMQPEMIEMSKRWTIYSHSESPDKIGRIASASEIFTEIKKDILFYKESDGGVTFSGGEPMMQTGFLKLLLQMCKEENISTAVDTSGYTEINNFELIYDLTDIFLFDLKVVNEEEHLKYTGLSNSLILSNLKALTDKGDKVIIRVPVIPGINDSEENISEIINLISSLKQLRQINLLPFHNSAAAKYKRINKPYRLNGIETPSAGYMDSLKQKFEAAGSTVIIGG
jgi:pyruvate formate lyase activating enzyme